MGRRDTLHDGDVLNHPVYRHDVAPVGVQLVAVGPLDEHGLPVDQQLASGYGYVAEAHTLAHHLLHCLALAQGHQEGVERGGLGRPTIHLRDGGMQPARHLVAGGIEQTGLDGSLAHVRHVHIEHTGAVHPVLADGQVGDVSLGARIEIHLTRYARQPPEVLVLEIGAVAPSHHLHGNEVAAALHIRRDIELGSYFRVLAVAHLSPIDPNRQVARRRAHVQVDALPVPRVGKVDGTAVRADIVVGRWHHGWVGVEGCGPRITDLLVDGGAIALQFK